MDILRARMTGERSGAVPRPTLRGVPASVLRSIGLGVAAGFVSGMFGVGGGVLVVPGLVLWMALDQHRASATSMATIVASAAAAVALFSIEGEIDWGAAVVIFVGAGTGAAIVARYVERVPEVWLTRTFAVAMMGSSIRLFFR